MWRRRLGPVAEEETFEAARLRVIQAAAAPGAGERAVGIGVLERAREPPAAGGPPAGAARGLELVAPQQPPVVGTAGDQPRDGGGDRHQDRPDAKRPPHVKREWKRTYAALIFDVADNAYHAVRNALSSRRPAG